MLNTNYARAEEVNQKIEEAKRGKMELSFFGSRVIPQCMEEFVHAWQSVDFQRQIVDWIHEYFSSFHCRHLPFCISNIAISLSQKFNRKSRKTKRGKVKFFALLLQSFTNRGKAEEDKVCDCPTEFFQKSDGWIQFSRTNIILKPRSYLVLFAASFQLQRVLPSTGSTNK